jgi:hypothetical protein
MKNFLIVALVLAALALLMIAQWQGWIEVNQTPNV